MKIPEGYPKLKEVRFENTNLCGFDCFFCPREKMSRKKGIQSMADFELGLQRVEEYVGGPFEGSVHLHGYGEPLLDKNLLEKIKIVSTRWPNSDSYIVTTLGYKLADGYLESLIENGLKRINVSFYGSTPESYKYNTTTDNFQIAYDNLMKLIKLNEIAKDKIKISVKTEIKGFKDIPREANKDDFNTILRSMNVTLTNGAYVHNYGSGRSYIKNPKKNLCFHAIYRENLQVTWDLNVVPCCFDFNSDMVLGNIRNSTIKEVFDSEYSKQFLADHCGGNGDNYSPCKNCSQRWLKDDKT